MSETDTRNRCILEALALLRTPYLWGGNDTKEGGLDCSGFIIYVWKKCGVNIPDMTASTMACYLSPTEHPKPGDVCFYGEGLGNITHCVMLLSMDPQDLVIGCNRGKSFRKCGIQKDLISELTDEEKQKYSEIMEIRGARVRCELGAFYRQDLIKYGSMPVNWEES